MDTILTFLNSIDPLVGGGVGAFLAALVGYSVYRKKKSKNSPLPKISKVEKEDDTSIISTPEPKKLWQTKKTAGLTFEEIIRSAIMFDEVNDKAQAIEFLEDALEISEENNKVKLQSVINDYSSTTNIRSLKEIYEQNYINNNETIPLAETETLVVPEGLSSDDLLSLGQDIQSSFKKDNKEDFSLLQLETENTDKKEDKDFLLEQGLTVLESEIPNFNNEETIKDEPPTIFGSPELESFMKEVAEDSEAQNEIIERESFDDQERIKALLAENFGETSSESHPKKFDGIKTMGSKSLSLAGGMFSHKYSMYVNWLFKEKNGTETLHREFIELNHKWPTKEAIDELNSIIDNKVQENGSWALISTTEIED